MILVFNLNKAVSVKKYGFYLYFFDSMSIVISIKIYRLPLGTTGAVIITSEGYLSGQGYAAGLS